MVFVLRLLGMLAVALAVGFGLSYYALTDGRVFGAIRSGPWSAWPDVGQESPDPYTRAYLSRSGILQLGYAEGVRFVAQNDSAGETLEANCSYRVEGRTPAASFWTLQAVDEAGVNIAADAQLRYIDSRWIARSGDGGANISVGPRMAGGNWLETEPSEAPFTLVLTLYDVVLYSGTDTVISQMPAITREDCA